MIFSNIHDIEAFHRVKLLPQLQRNSGDIEGVATVFVECVSREEGGRGGEEGRGGGGGRREGSERWSK